MTVPLAPAIRGPLKYAIDTSSPQVEAGKRFSVSVRVANPYDVPVTLSSIETKLPAKFLSFPEDSTPPKGRTERTLAWLDRIASHSAASGQLVKASATPAGTEDATLLQPGNSTVRVFVLRTTNSTFFTPSAYNLNLEVQYEIDGKPNRDTVSYQMNVRAPLGAIILGAVIGALIGFIVRDNQHENSLRSLLIHPDPGSRLLFLLSLVATVLIAGIVTVAFARKKDAQPILSIEDFWGGLFVGFLSAYGGNTLLAQLSPGSAPTAPSAS